ncbi:MAG: hypothetical protein KatS3mg102_1700 [Planctomycetota bacterium]|nr:MAG: hypothetical protein KatS3mg102_1700 [Planctomycetota bacterium]
MQIAQDRLDKKYHDAVERWQQRYFPDYPLLLHYWEKYFPRQQPFCLCSKLDLSTPEEIQVGRRAGEKKFTRAEQMEPEQAHRLLQIIKAQASTEFGSIQQHQGSLDKAQDDEEKFFVLRVMAEELRHGYQMFHLLTRDDWSQVSEQKGEEIVEEVLSMKTGSHVLGAFNIEYDSFVDNIVFAAVIDRVGKYQLTMQKVCAYKPMAASMPPMLQEEAFHLAAGVVPLRRWVRKAATGEITVPMAVIQRYLNKWVPRGYEMFGHEKGGQTNIELGFKDMTNLQALRAYQAELGRMVEDLNRNYVRARLPELGPEEARALVASIQQHRERQRGIEPEELLRLPDERFFRRRGLWSHQMWSVDGEPFRDFEDYRRHLAAVLPEPYLAHRDFGEYLGAMRRLQAGEIDLKTAEASAPRLVRTSYCPCSKSVRWIVEEGQAAAGEPTAGGARCEPRASCHGAA